MAYATQADMEDRYGAQMLVELTDRADPPANAIQAGVLNKALDQASAIIDSYVGKRYKLPVNPTPAVLTSCCCAMAYFDLHRGRYADETRVAYEDALRTLTNISSGSMVLDVAGKEAQSAGAQVAHTQPNRQFSRRNGEW